MGPVKEEKKISPDTPNTSCIERAAYLTTCFSLLSPIWTLLKNYHLSSPKGRLLESLWLNQKTTFSHKNAFEIYITNDRKLSVF